MFTNFKNYMFNLIYLLIFLTAVNLKAVTVIIDPGHGGYDKGAVYGKAQESEIVLKVATELKKLIDSQNKKNQSMNDTKIDLSEQNTNTTTSTITNPTIPISVYLTRTKEEFISLQNRVKKAEENNGDIFVSLHANASEDKRAKGFEFFIQPQAFNINHKNSSESDENFLLQELGSKMIDDELSKKKDLQNIVLDIQKNFKIRKSLNLTRTLKKELPGNIKQAPFYVISKTQIPSVLIEVGFLSHPKENKRLLSEDYQKEIAGKILSSLNAFLMQYNQSNLSIK